MRYLCAVLAGLVLYGVMGLASVAFGAGDPPTARALTKEDMHAPPITAAVFSQCNLIVAIYFTLADGTLVKADKEHHPDGVSAGTILDYANTATRGAERVEARCDSTPATAL